jgi:anaerobic selenocysteine-containing dehydrogenase
VQRGFAREDLFTVVLEHFQTDTADYADILLPATTQLEHVDAHLAYGHLYMMANNAAIAPLGEAKPNTEIFRLLAARMGFDDPCFDETDDELAAQAFDKQDARAVHFDWESLKRKGWQQAEHAGRAVCRRRLSRRRPASASSIPRRCWPTASIRCRPTSRRTNRWHPIRNWRRAIRWR